MIGSTPFCPGCVILDGIFSTGKLSYIHGSRPEGESVASLLCGLIHWPGHCLLCSLWGFAAWTPTSETGSGNSLQGTNSEHTESRLFISRVVRNTISCCLLSKALKIVPYRLSNVFFIVSSEMVNLVPVSWRWLSFSECISQLSSLMLNSGTPPW